MQSIFRSIITELSKKSKKWSSGIKLRNRTWYVYDQDGTLEGRYIFENNDVLMISTSTGVIKGKWSIVIHLPGIFIEVQNEAKLLIPIIEMDKFILFKQDIVEDIFIFSEENYTPEQLVENIQRVISKVNAPKIMYYYVFDKGENRGPYTKDQIIRKYINKELMPMSFIRTIEESNFLNKKRVIDLINNKI